MKILTPEFSEKSILWLNYKSPRGNIYVASSSLCAPHSPNVKFAIYLNENFDLNENFLTRPEFSEKSILWLNSEKQVNYKSRGNIYVASSSLWAAHYPGVGIVNYLNEKFHCEFPRENSLLRQNCDRSRCPRMNGSKVEEHIAAFTSSHHRNMALADEYSEFIE
ncbi:hypothetical protein OUZ56_031259 [Daphnia magna]|uniref:Uncharacterized protein n=1 Tax=Daphnia magna TaxID=35525 RepID=A0ABQ9ZTR1_9CRUS|nr:hypothetical protein OUZ56_031259 [Daphnia magna]